jgi:hypothetical protein
MMPRCFAVSKLRVTMVLRSVMSALSKWVTWGISAADSAMRSAMVRRRCDALAPTGPPLLELRQGRRLEADGGQRLGRAGGRGRFRGRLRSASRASAGGAAHRRRR